MDNNDETLGLGQKLAQDGSLDGPFGGIDEARIETSDGPFGVSEEHEQQVQLAQVIDPQIIEPLAMNDQPAVKIGKVEELSGQVTVTRADGTDVVLSKGAAIYQGDAIETGAGAAVGIIFVDSTTFSLGESGNMVIDEMVYDSSSQEGTFAASISQGVFSFVSGRLPRLVLMR